MAASARRLKRGHSNRAPRPRTCDEVRGVLLDPLCVRSVASGCSRRGVPSTSVQHSAEEAHMLDNPGTFVLAAGALGTAAFGIVEGLKRWRPIGEAGVNPLLAGFRPNLATLKVADGGDAGRMLPRPEPGGQQGLPTGIRPSAPNGLMPGQTPHTSPTPRAH